MIRYFLLFLILGCSIGASVIAPNEEDLLSRVSSHLLIDDYKSALHEVEIGKKLFPDSKEMHESLIDVLSEAGRELEAYKAYKEYTDKYDDEKINTSLLESLCWGILKGAEHSTHLTVNITTLMGALATHDARAVTHLMHFLNSSNSYLRGVAVSCVANYRDQILVNKIRSMLKSEEMWYVRLQLIQTIGYLDLKEEIETLKEIVSSHQSSVEEKGCAIASIVNMTEDINDKELQSLLSSKRAGLRSLACDIIAHLDLEQSMEGTVKLLEDPAPQVRIAALNTIWQVYAKGYLQPNMLKEVMKLKEDQSPEVAITAGFVLLHFAPEIGQNVLKKWVFSKQEKYARLAASALSIGGRNGKKLCKLVAKKSKDPYVRANIAIGLLSHKEDACSMLYDFLQKANENIAFGSSFNPLLRTLEPSEARHIPGMPGYPSYVDQVTRLELLSLLAMKRYPKAENAIKDFLTNHFDGISYQASKTLIEEGDVEIFSILKNLIEDKNPKLRVQAALALCFYGEDSKAIEVLQNAYQELDREYKIHIIRALGELGEQSSLIFLVKLLDDPFQVIRLSAAGSILQCLYH